MFDKNQWMQWAQTAKDNNPKMKDFRNEYWHANNVQEQGDNKVDSLAEAARQVMSTNAPVELDEGIAGGVAKGIGTAAAMAAKSPAMRAAASYGASKIANKMKASIAKKKAEKTEGAGEENRAKKVAEGEEVEENLALAPKGKGNQAAKKLYANYESILDDEENADEDDERKAGKEDDKKEGAGEENRAKAKKVAEGIGSVIGGAVGSVVPGVGTAIGAAVGGAGEALVKGAFKKSKGAGESGKEEDIEYPSKMKRKRLAMKKK